MTQAGFRVLVVDDEQAIRRFLRASLVAHGYTVLEACTGTEALQAVGEGRPDVILLDLGLPDMDGVEVLRRLREWSRVPAIILSVRDSESTKVEALDAGADDYLTKPFYMGELLARMRAALRHAIEPAGEPVLEVGSLRVDWARRQVSMGDSAVVLTPTEYDLLRALAQHAGKVLTHRQLLREVWGSAYEPETHLLQVNVSNLRRKIEPDASRPTYVLTEVGVGYRLRAE
jgi:two-component system, OmpR family, KDP operon response regulator KdpE